MLKGILLACYLLSVPYIALASGEKILSPDEVVSTFYHYYLVAEEMSDMESANDLSLKAIAKYTTEHLRNLRDNDDSGADYFVDAQDICEEWKTNIGTKTVLANDHMAVVNLRLGYGKGTSLYAVSLVKVGGKWLIDSVKPTFKGSIYCPQQFEGDN
ncbi:DUF3828 domain-containing protein [Enterobacter sp. RIT418]|uniref:DUF3828 domain-containing protein n=1 Tax=Enterobacter sp. RIT418 TaxID=2202164 RepID=UPI000D4A934C|nr:DUF3828 domain-containing protein [Enterobacter sp. RIT 418]RAU29669.1 hypothetical protein DBY73_021810 [Enterobacter sp. RIT 418]